MANITLLQDRRELRGYSINELSKLTGIDEKTLIAYEKEKKVKKAHYMPLMKVLHIPKIVLTYTKSLLEIKQEVASEYDMGHLFICKNSDNGDLLNNT